MSKIDAAYIEITNRCNLNCENCYNASGNNRDVVEIPPDTLIAYIELLREAGATQIMFSGGEPTMHTHWNDIVHAIAAISDIDFTLVSNGISHSPSYASLCAKSERYCVQISLDGSCEEVNAINRGIGSFLKTTKAIEAYSNAAKKTRVKMVLSQKNLGDLEHFFRMVTSLDCQPEFGFVNRQGSAIERWKTLMLTPEQKISALVKIIELSSELGTNTQQPMCTTGCPFADPDKPLSLLVKPNGDIHPCQLLYDDRFNIGNMNTFKYDKLLKDLGVIFEIAKQRLQMDYGCSSCINRSGCRKGCIAEAFDQTADPLGCDSNCDVRRLQTLRFGLQKLLKAEVVK